MPIRKYEIDPPFAFEDGDTFTRVGNVVKQIRDSIEIDSRTVTATATLTAQFHFGTNSITELLEEFHMPGIVQTLTDVIKNNTTGVIRFKFADGSEREFENFAAYEAAAQYIDTDVVVAQDMLILKTLRNSPDGANLENMIGGSVAIDFNANVPVVMTVE